MQHSNTTTQHNNAKTCHGPFCCATTQQKRNATQQRNTTTTKQRDNAAQQHDIAKQQRNNINRQQYNKNRPPSAPCTVYFQRESRGDCRTQQQLLAPKIAQQTLERLSINIKSTQRSTHREGSEVEPSVDVKPWSWAGKWRSKQQCLYLHTTATV